MKWTAADVVHALREAYGVTASNLVTDEWSLLTEVPLRSPRMDPVSGRPIPGYWGREERRIDVLLVRNWTSGIGHRRIAVEVKVSRSDFRNETPAKRAPAEATAHRTAYAAPAGVIPVEELPDGWGLIEVHEAAEADREVYRCRWRRKAVDRTPVTDDYLVAAVARQASRLAELLRRGEGDAAEVVNLRADVERLEGQLARRDSAVYRERQRVAVMRGLLSVADGFQDCADCGETVRYQPSRLSWAHVDRAHERACQVAREDAAKARREAATGTLYLRGYADPVEPVAMRRARDAESTDPLSGVDFGA